MGDIEKQAKRVVQKVKHYLITQSGVTDDEASDEQFYHAFASSLREEIMINWTATSHTWKKNKPRIVYYLSLEYMPGRLLGNSLTNACVTDLAKLVMKKMNRKFSNIIHIEPDIGIGNGGLGRLASCLMDSLASLKYPAMGYGMRYQYGIFEQEVWAGVQVERPDCWLLRENPWEFRHDERAVSVKYCGRPIEGLNSHGDKVFDIADYEEVRSLPFDLPIIGYSKTPDHPVGTLRLWSTKESPRNFGLQKFNAGRLDQAAENTSLTDVLYPNDNHDAGKRIRLKQEFLLVSASIQDIVNQYLSVYDNFDSFADKVRIQTNDTHPALTTAELMRLLNKNHNIEWNKAWEITKTCCSYTNHTILKEALEEWNEERLGYLLPRQYNIIQRINQEFLSDVRKKFPNDEERVNRMSIIHNGQIRMANLSIYGSHKVNGVAALHTDILRKTLFKDFDEMYPGKLINVTNGVTHRRWLLMANPKLAEFISSRIGHEWILDFRHIKNLASFADDPKAQEEFLEIKAKNKRNLLGHLHQHLIDRHWGGHNLDHDHFLSEDALYDVHVKRLHEYKRQLMKALHTLMIYQDLKEDPSSHTIKRFVLIGGKAAPGYHLAKDIIRFIYILSRNINTDKAVSDKLKILFYENYNVSKAEIIIPATDLSEQISMAGLEASGTGNMKFSMNGALTIGTDDGANVEMREAVTDEWWPFLFGASSDENEKVLSEKSYNPNDIVAQNRRIRQAVEALRDHSLVENEAEHESLMNIYNSLFEPPSNHSMDRYLVLRDMDDYDIAQKNVEVLFAKQNEWAKYCIHNIAGMGMFSTDESIHNYAGKIWDIKPCPLDPAELKQVRADYEEHSGTSIIQPD